MKNEEKTVLLKGSYSELSRLAFPLVISNFSWSVLHLVDTAFLSRLGQEALAAVGMCSVFAHLLFVTLLGMSMAMKILIARAMGAQQLQEAARYFWSGILLLVGLGIILGGTAHLFLDVWVPGIVRHPVVQRLVVLYLSIYLLFVPVTALFVGLRALLIARARTTIFAVVIVVINFCNGLLDYVLIFGKWGAPRLEFAGAAWATVLSVCLGSGLLAGILWLGERDWLRTGSPHRSAFLQVLRTGLPLVGQYLVAIAGWVLFFVFVEKRGAYVLAVSTATSALLSLLSVGGWGLAPVVSATVSNLIGQGQIARVFHVVHRAMILSLLWHACMIGLFLVFQPFFLRLYTDDPAIQAGIRQLLPNIIVILLLFSVSTLLFNALAGTAWTQKTFLVETGAVTAYVSFAAWTVLIWQAPLWVIWFSEAVYWLVLAVLAAWFFYKRRHRWIALALNHDLLSSPTETIQEQD